MVRSAATPRVSNHEATMLPVRIGVNEAAPAAAVERDPRAFLLRQAIGNRVDRGRVVAHAAMAALDLDALDHLRGLLAAALPGADAVGAAEDRGGRHRRRTRQRTAETRILLLGAAA